MLNFLRKLRRLTASGSKEMKGTKYLKYALGEILLVVIGILIALSINNWNQGRLARVEERKFLQSIKVDFERTKSLLQALNERREESLINFKALIEVRNSGDFSNKVQIDTLLAKSTFTPTFNGSTSSIAILINSGKINLLANDSLKSLLLAWPGQLENLIEREVDAKVVTNDEWMPFAQQYTSVNDWFKNYSFPAPARNRTSEVSKDYRGLFGDRDFENTITKLELLYVAGSARAKGLINRAEDIIATIDEDLENR